MFFLLISHFFPHILVLVSQLKLLCDHLQIVPLQLHSTIVLIISCGFETEANYAPASLLLLPLVRSADSNILRLTLTANNGSRTLFRNAHPTILLNAVHILFNFLVNIAAGNELSLMSLHECRQSSRSLCD